MPRQFRRFARAAAAHCRRHAHACHGRNSDAPVAALTQPWTAIPPHLSRRANACPARSACQPQPWQGAMSRPATSRAEPSNPVRRQGCMAPATGAPTTGAPTTGAPTTGALTAQAAGSAIKASACRLLCLVRDPLRASRLSKAAGIRGAVRVRGRREGDPGQVAARVVTPPAWQPVPVAVLARPPACARLRA